MPLTGPQQASLAALIVQEGGLSPFLSEVAALHAANAQTVALNTLAPAVTVTVQDWNAVTTYLASTPKTTVPAIMGGINAAAGKQDAALLGPLMVALYAAVKNNWSL